MTVYHFENGYNTMFEVPGGSAFVISLQPTMAIVLHGTSFTVEPHHRIEGARIVKLVDQARWAQFKSEPWDFLPWVKRQKLGVGKIKLLRLLEGTTYQKRGVLNRGSVKYQPALQNLVAAMVERGLADGSMDWRKEEELAA